jgi:4-hydroxyacetophenone monooxygenase
MKQDFRNAVANEAQLRAALAEADIGPTMMVLAHLSGETEILDEVAPHIQGAWNYQQTVPEELKAKVRDRLVAVLKDYAATGRAIPKPDSERLRRMMTASVGSKVPEEYVPLLVEELRLGDTDTRALQWREDPKSLPLTDYPVLIIGAGFAGMCTGIRLKDAGIPFVILEKNSAPGGTWQEHTYPGCGVDTPNHFYSFSFNPNDAWTDHFSKRDEIRAYVDDTITKYGLAPFIRYDSAVTSACYDEASGTWSVTHTDTQGKSHTVTARVVIAGVGHNVPSTPKFEGLDSFKGPVVHTAAWDASVELKGKRVVMIGTGASGIQVGPTIAPDVAKLTVFQRTPHWAWGDPNYHKPIAEGHKWALKNIPLFMEWQRFQLFWAVSDAFHKTLHVDPTWDKPDQSLNADNQATRERLTNYITQELEGDAELMAKCIPSYPPYGKRMLRDNHWFRMLRKPNVELVTSGVARITPEGVVDKDGTLHPADVIIMATGFHAAKLLFPMEIIGRNGRSLRNEWGDSDPRAYKGMSVPGFPNFFVLAGPNTILAHGGSAIFHIECQVTYVLGALRYMIENKRASIEVKPEVYEQYNELVEGKLQKMVWSHRGVTSWYKNDKNRVTMTSPWRLVDFWNITRNFDSSEFIVKPLAKAAAAQLAAARATETSGADA